MGLFETLLLLKRTQQGMQLDYVQVQLHDVEVWILFQNEQQLQYCNILKS